MSKEKERIFAALNHGVKKKRKVRGGIPSLWFEHSQIDD